MTDAITDPAKPEQKARIPTSRYVLFAVIAAAGCVADLLTKQLVFQWRGMPRESPIWWLWNGKIGVETSLNTGALFGLGQDKVLFFAVFSIIALFGVIGWFVFARVGRDLLLTIILACVTGGILGNLYDRLGLWEPTYLHAAASADAASAQDPTATVFHTRHFAVRDWIRLSYGEYVWPNFNIADCLLVVGAAMLVWHSFRAPSVSHSAVPLAKGS